MVCPDYQGKGIGTDLMDKMIEYLKEKRIYIISVVYEECLKLFYERFGFYNMRTLPRIHLHLFRHFCPKLLEIRRYSCVVLGNLTKKPTARLHDNLCAVLL